MDYLRLQTVARCWIPCGVWGLRRASRGSWLAWLWLALVWSEVAPLSCVARGACRCMGGRARDHWLPRTLHADGLGAAWSRRFGSNFAIYPTLIADMFGARTTGANYGLAFVAYGIGTFTIMMFLRKVAESDHVFLHCWGFSLAGTTSVAVLALRQGCRRPKHYPLPQSAVD